MNEPNTNDTNIIKIQMPYNYEKLIHPELSYSVVGVCFEAHNEIGRYGREKQYGDYIARKLNELKIEYKREYVIDKTGNRADFVIEGKIILELKTADWISKDDYYQVQRYLQASHIDLGILINFRNQYIRPKRIVRIETDVRKKFI